LILWFVWRAFALADSGCITAYPAVTFSPAIDGMGNPSWQKWFSELYSVAGAVVFRIRPGLLPLFPDFKEMQLVFPAFAERPILALVSSVRVGNHEPPGAQAPSAAPQVPRKRRPPHRRWLQIITLCRRTIEE